MIIRQTTVGNQSLIPCAPTLGSHNGFWMVAMLRARARARNLVVVIPMLFPLGAPALGTIMLGPTNPGIILVTVEAKTMAGSDG